MNEILKLLSTTHDEFTLRSAVEALESKGMTPEDSSCSLLEALKNDLVVIEDNYVLAIKRVP